MSEELALPGSEEHTRLEARADRVRERLTHTIEALEQKRRDALDLRLQVRKHVKAAVIALALLSFAVGGGAALLVVRVTQSRGDGRVARLLALVGWFALALIARLASPGVPALAEQSGGRADVRSRGLFGRGLVVLAGALAARAATALMERVIAPRMTEWRVAEAATWRDLGAR
jgi:hypothetical protein